MPADLNNPDVFATLDGTIHNLSNRWLRWLGLPSQYSEDLVAVGWSTAVELNQFWQDGAGASLKTFLWPRLNHAIRLAALMARCPVSASSSNRITPEMTKPVEYDDSSPEYRLTRTPTPEELYAAKEAYLMLRTTTPRNRNGHQSTINERDVVAAWALGYTLDEIADRYGVSRQRIDQVKRRAVDRIRGSV